MSTVEMVLFLIIGYVVTTAIEGPVLYFGLSDRISRSDRITYGLLLTAFTYPVVVIVLPTIFSMAGLTSRALFLVIAETFAPVAEVLLFRFVSNQNLFRRPDRDAFVIVFANLASFILGEAFLSELIFRLIQQI